MINTTEMKENIIDYIATVETPKTMDECLAFINNIKDKISKISHIDFVSNIKNLWYFVLDKNSCVFDQKRRESYKKYTLVEFVQDLKYDISASDFLNQNWDRISEIFSIIQDLINTEDYK